MTLILEDGTGVADANAYTTATEVTAYLTDRDRQTENGWDGKSTAERDAAIVKATDFIEQRWSDRFMGRRKFQDISAARATLTLTGQPADAETVTIGSVTYTFNTSLGGANSVLIGASTTVSIQNLDRAIAAVVTEAGSTHGIGTVAHPDVTGKEGFGDTLFVRAKKKGTAGNGIATTETLVNASWSSATLRGGGDVVTPQSLSFPRSNLLDREGLVVGGIPPKLKAATSEYAIRAVAANLMPDPTVDGSGRTIVRLKEKVGPIETDTAFERGGSLSQLLRPYPAADRLLSEYITGGGAVVRG